jgi:bifunctional DNA-binding transcriptional regulator/antitoxin component of YhaV-PrlF toxin-antitoxin module
MPQVFRLKVAARRQVTLPQELLDVLNLSEGDVLEITVRGDSVVGRGLKLIPSRLFTPEILEQLKRRETEISEGGALEVGNEQEPADKLHARPQAVSLR